MPTLYEVHHSWTDYGRPGGTQLDFDVFRGSDVVGRFKTREAAQARIRELEIEDKARVLSIHIQEAYDSYEIKEIKVAPKGKK